MESLIHADIFFFITSIVAVILGILIAIILAYLVIILRDIREISRIARSETTDLADDIHTMRSEVHNQLRKNSSILTSIIYIIRGFFRRRKSRITKY